MKQLIEKYLLLGFVLLTGLVMSSCKKDNAGPVIDLEEQAAREDQIIRQYLRENNIDATATQTGIYYFKSDSLVSGKQAETGNTVRFNFIVSVIYDREIQNTYVEGKPYQVTLGEGEIIEGVDYALRQLKVGERGLFFIPSAQGYKSKIISSIPPYSVLIFDIKLEEIL